MEFCAAVLPLCAKALIQQVGREGKRCVTAGKIDCATDSLCEDCNCFHMTNMFLFFCPAWFFKFQMVLDLYYLAKLKLQEFSLSHNALHGSHRHRVNDTLNRKQFPPPDTVRSPVSPRVLASCSRLTWHLHHRASAARILM